MASASFRRYSICHRPLLQSTARPLLQPPNRISNLVPSLAAVAALLPPIARFVTMAPPSDRRPIVISGPSGVGKGTLYNRLFARHPNTFCLSVSHTTRKPRAGEADGEHYHFVTMEEFEKLIAQDAFVEHAMFGGNRYGTSKKTVADQTAKGRVVVLDIEMEGVKQIQQQKAKGNGWEARYIFIAPPSAETLEKRLRGRGTETEASVQKRLAQAKLELKYSKTPGVHDKIIINDDLDKAYQELEDYIFQGTPNAKQ